MNLMQLQTQLQEINAQIEQKRQEELAAKEQALKDALQQAFDILASVGVTPKQFYRNYKEV
jgi:hypothetical protein